MFLQPSARVRQQAAQSPSALIHLADNHVTGVKRWYHDAGLRKMMFWLSIIFAAQICTGFDATLTANFQSFAIWKADMGHPNASQLGLITAIYFIGTFCGSVPASIITDKWGRRAGLGVGQFLTIVGAAFQAASQSRGQYMGSRLILGFGIAFTTCAGPALLSELAHPRLRGTLVSCFNPFWYVGSIIAAWTCFGTSHMPKTEHWAWRIPSLIQGVIPCVTLTLIFFMPESPRWLNAQGRKDEALNTLARYHANGQADDPLVLAEMAEIDCAIDQASEGITWKALLMNKTNRVRVSIVVTMTLMTLWCGQNIITYYFVQVLNSVGITQTTQQTAINGGLNIANLISSVIGAFIADRIGRRKLWMSSFIGMIIIAVPFISLSAVYLEKAEQRTAYGVIICLFLYDIAYNVACNPLLYSYPTEIMPFFMRSKGLAIKNMVGQVALIINMYVNPIALSAIGYHYYIVFLALNCLWLALIWVFFPETKGYTLEELAGLFENNDMVIEGVKVVDVDMEDSTEQIGNKAFEGRNKL
ncbi:lactose permease [Coleophoma cylindrospora]|uniref:Lactose permease n=1 Tax=Coleophoma cylindrospora TaxID=1849047 RepID=A0A3D8QW55_9HELO|nr:lactose permease [Coleophoma cylindrospora]